MAVTHSPTHEHTTSPSNSNSFDNHNNNSTTTTTTCNMNGNNSRKTRDDEYSILGSDRVSDEHILADLKHVKQESQIIKLELEDLLTSDGHHNLLPVAKAVFTCDQRDWKRIRFYDSIQVTNFAWWQGLKTMIMRDYEDNLPDHLLEFLTVEAQLVIPDATPEVLLPLLKQLPQDEDIVAMTFGGAFDGVDIGDIPEELDHCLESGDTDIGITIELICGWQDEEAEEDTEWIDLCAACRDVLKEHKHNQSSKSKQTNEDTAAAAPPTLSRNKSAPVRGVGSRDAPSGRETPVRMPSRRVQRGVSRDEVEEAQQQQQQQINPRRPPSRCNTDPGLGDDDLEESTRMDSSSNNNNRSRAGGGVPRMPSRGARSLSRQAPERAKSLGGVPSRSSSAADRLALLGASGSKRVGSRRIPEGRALPERSASGRRTPTRTSSRKVPEAGESGRSLPPRTNSRRGPPARSSSRKVSRQEEVDAAAGYDDEE